MEKNQYLVANKNLTSFKTISALVTELYGYFINLLAKSNEILDEINTDRECYGSKSNAFIQDAMHMIFLYKYNKMDYKKMNHKLIQVIAKIKNLEQSKKNNIF